MNSKQIARLGFQKRAAKWALTAAEAREEAGLSRSEILDELQAVQADPRAYLSHPVYGDLAAELTGQLAGPPRPTRSAPLQPAELRRTPLPYRVWGEDLIEPGAREQMDVAMLLPISRAGALMPDAHVGYGLPIGGVLAAEDAVIPYGVGVDIGCSMRLSVLPLKPGELDSDDARKLLLKHTRFGAGVSFEKAFRGDHEVLHEETWREQALLRHLWDKAAEQIGTSGSGNHFVEFGTLTLQAPDLGLEAGEYLALLSHSGSRGFGAQVAGHYTKVAQDLHPTLDPAARKLAWLPMQSEEGQGYWQAMNLAGRYALANHDLIHRRLARALNVEPLATVSNSHNLAWRQRVGERDLIVHRKGATPAERGQLGLIPGSMADPGYVVRGLGNPEALASASHGAGRQMGRKAAERALNKRDVYEYLKERGVTLIGGGVDEAPQAYKRIENVIARQRDLVDVVAEFRPRVVRMDTGKADV